MDEFRSEPGSDTELSLSVALPLAWRVGPPPADAGGGWRETGVLLLRALASLDSHAVAEHDSEQAAELRRLERLEAKLDLLLLLEAEARRGERPPTRDMVLRASGVEWREIGAPPPAGARLGLQLHLSPLLPLPLALPARVLTVTPPQGLEGGRVATAFEPLGEELEDAFTRTLFRFHRRAIHARHGGGRPSG